MILCLAYGRSLRWSKGAVYFEMNRESIKLEYTGGLDKWNSTNRNLLNSW